MSLQLVTLGVALGDVSHEVRETVGKPNTGPRVSWYLSNCSPPILIPAPWCAAFVQGCSDIAARSIGIDNPLDAVRKEALVLSYYEWAQAANLLVTPGDAAPGDLVFYDFNKGGNPWDHVGFLLEPPGIGGAFRAVEGNTGPPTQNQRDGDGVYIKGRRVGAGYPVAFARWGA